MNLNEATGEVDSKLLSDLADTDIEIQSVEISEQKGRDKEGTESTFKQAIFILADGSAYRTSNQAVLGKAEKLQGNIPKGSTVMAHVEWVKPRKGGNRYLDLTPVKENGKQKTATTK